MIRNQHISFTHELWKKHLNPHDVVVDATCGNGKDSLALLPSLPRLYLLDIQAEALNTSKKLLGHYPYIQFFHQSHESFPPLPNPPRLIIYNLGYLPGGDKALTTKTSSTLMSIQAALDILAEDGLITIMCYPGHPEGAVEADAIKKFIESHSNRTYSFFERPSSPFLIVLAKLKKYLPI